MNQRDLEVRIQELLDGDLAPEDQRDLVAHLRNDPGALELYRQYAVVDSSLRRLTQGKLELSEDHSIAAIARKRSRFRSLEFTWIAAAAIITISLVSLRFIFPKEEQPILTLRASADTRFTVVHAEEGPAAAQDSTLAVGSRLQISQGTMELAFASGVTSIVRAPVSLTLHADDHLYLERGTTWFHVPEDARGFQVTTPELEIVDLGTEFGVLATPDGSDEVHVFRGSVQARSRNPLRNEATLGAGQARRSDPAGRLKETAPRPQEFLTSLPASLPHLYFSFDSIAGDRLRVEGSHPAAPMIDARLVSASPGSRLVPGHSGTALSFDGGPDHVATDWPGFAGTAPRSVAFWLRIPPGMEPAPSLPAIVGWGDPANRLNAKWKVHVSRQNEDQLLVPRISFGIERYDGRTALDDGKWHHLAAIYYGRSLDSGRPEVALYLDGRPEQLLRYTGPVAPPGLPREIRTLVETADARTLHIGTGVVRTPISFEGELDELYIYEGALSEESIQTLFNAPRS